MKPVFPRINKAIQFTLEYYSRGQIIEYIEAYAQIAKNGSSYSYKVDNWEELLFDLHDQMEQEILQTIYTSDHNTRVIMFEELREWLEIDWRLKSEPNWIFFWKTVDEHNEKVNSELEQKLEMEVAKFQDTEEYKTLGENEEYEKEVHSSPLWSLGQKTYSYKTTKINRKYYCNEIHSKFLDYYQVKPYRDFVKKIVGNFRLKIEKHLKLFDEGKYLSLQEIATQKENLRIHPPEQKLIDAPQSFGKKMVMDLSVPQLVALFSMFREMKVINEPVNTELARFIKANFSTKGSVDISEKTLVNLLSSLDVTAIDHWLLEIKNMRIALANLKQ